MIYGLSAWEKPDRLQPRLFFNGNTVVVQKTKFATSQEWLALGAVTLIISVGSFLFPYLVEGGLPTLAAINMNNILPAVGALAGILLITKSKEGMRLRNEQGGIHPEDTLLVLDGSKRVFTKQKGTLEETLASLQDLSLAIRILRSSKQTEYRIVATYPQGSEALAKYSTQKGAEAMLQNLKTRLQLP